MDERNEISVELRALSELVSGIGRQTPYQVPVGYFEQLPSNVMSRIAPGLTIFPAAGTIFPAAAPTFQVPDGYFDRFATSVLDRIKQGASIPMGESVDAELSRLSPVISGISRITPYGLPEGYFDELSPVLALLRDTPAYMVPQGYFDELSPLLTVAQGRSTYQVPEGYFAGLPETILEKVAAPVSAMAAPVSAAKVVAMRRDGMRSDGMTRDGGKVLKGHWWKYSSVAAIAACFLLIFTWPQVGTRIGEGDMTVAVSQDLQKVSDQEMQTYLDDEHAILAEPVNNSTATLDMNEGEVKSFLSEVSDSDLQQYMEEHGKADDLATN